LLIGGDRSEVAEQVESLRPQLAEHLDIICSDDCFAADLSGIDADLAIVFGGDGSILRAARQMGRHQLPVLGVNFGRLGFLADLQPEELLTALPKVLSGECRVVEHLMFRCRMTRGEETIIDELGLNEATIFAGPPFSILDIQLYVDSELATTYSCDGLIVSTPVGSTAHSLSAGGPILRKSLQAFVISPISPHTLTNRPVVDSADRKYELVVPRPYPETSLVVDGKLLTAINEEDRIHIERSDASFRLIEVPGHTYYRTLREKLGWGGGLSSKSSR